MIDKTSVNIGCIQSKVSVVSAQFKVIMAALSDININNKSFGKVARNI